MSQSELFYGLSVQKSLRNKQGGDYRDSDHEEDEEDEDSGLIFNERLSCIKKPKKMIMYPAIATKTNAKGG